VYFGRKPNRYRNKLFLGGKKQYEVPEENNNDIKMDECKTEELTELVKERNSIRQKARDASNKASQYMVKRELRRNPPSLYYKGETVLIRVPVSKKLVKGKKNSLKNTCEGVILEADHSVHKYFISYSDPVTLKSKTGWFKVDEVTSVTKEEENDWQQKTKSDSGRRNANCTGHEADSPGQPAKRARTDNASLLEASIDQIISSEKLNGDTVNLYFDFLGNSRAFGEGNWGFASSYFYPSLHRPVETSTYSKHIGNNALWEQLMVPVHLPTENHWLLVLISVLNVCLYIYDSPRCTAATYRTICDAIKEGFIRNELQWLSDEDRTLFQEDNWDESTP